MFQHRGEHRTYKHNLSIAALLSFIAGLVNVAGFLSIEQLTTNVTGHFAFLVEETLQLHYWDGLTYFLYILFFFAGSFTSGWLVEYTQRKKEEYVYVVPVLLECLLLISVAIFAPNVLSTHPNWIAFTLLFSMGLQNSLVTSISRSAVRTTHLTGLFTDLGIELAQWMFYRKKEEKDKLSSSMFLRLVIICCFFTGGIVAGVLFGTLGSWVFGLGGMILFLGLLADTVKVKKGM